VATTYGASPLSSVDGFGASDCPQLAPGAAALDAPLGEGWLLDVIDGGFSGVSFSPTGDVPGDVARGQAALRQRNIPVHDVATEAASACARYGAVQSPAYYLFRPDGYVAARWRRFAPEQVEAAMARATGRSGP
jgi:3-(3-hydroxy-phenyl)propionate hydroxylase